MSYHIMLFEIIAPFYNLAFRRQFKNYKKLISENSKCLPRKTASVLDIGCGTGAFALALENAGFNVTAVDASSLMIKISRKNLRNSSVKVEKGDFQKKLPYEDKSFDFVVASFVLHGYKTEGRKELYKEISRISKNGVLFHEFFPNNSFIVSAVEWIERSDYHAFVNIAYDELKENFSQVEKIRLSKTYGWYICKNPMMKSVVFGKKK